MQHHASAKQARRTLSERGRDYRQAPAQLRRRGEVCLVQGYGVRVAVHHGQLAISDGAGRARRNRSYGRSGHGLSRVVVIGSAGSISLEALRWLADLGIGFLHLDRDGRLLTHSAEQGIDDARLRRAQALAISAPTGGAVARYLLTEKLNGQRRLLEQLIADPETTAAFDAAQARLETANTIDELVYAERDAALAYWTTWKSLEIRFRAGDLGRTPEHWLGFGQRVSPLTKAPRLAVNPINALLNYLYALVEAETRIACLATGLDPGLGIVHADTPGRASLALDLMEPIRPTVDRYVLDLIDNRIFRASDFHETRKGSCRILQPLSHELAETTPTWAAQIAPVVEHVASILARSPDARIDRLSTPLTGTNRSAGRTRRTPARPKAPAPPKPKPTCRRCGNPVPDAGRTYCDDCLPAYQREQHAASFFHGSGLRAIERAKADGSDPTHGGKAAQRRGRTNATRKAELAEWEARYGRLTDLSAFQREILPMIQGVPLSRLQHATGLSLRYVSLIRRGEKTPHPRHWPSLAEAAGPPPKP